MSRRAVVLRLGIAQTIAWASSYYLPAILAEDMAVSVGVPTATVFLIFSFALGLSAFLGPVCGRWIDRHGGHGMLGLSNGLLALGLLMLASAESLIGLVGGWLLVGLGMACGLYDPAFATLVRLYGPQARGAITGITLIAGFASTVGWPVTALIESAGDWRDACLFWAALHLLVALPLNASLPRGSAEGPRVPNGSRTSSTAAAPSRRELPGPESGFEARPIAVRHLEALLALFFGIALFITGAMATHLPAVLQQQGFTLAEALALGALVGPAQVVARLTEWLLIRRVAPVDSAMVAAVAHPLGALLLLGFGKPLAMAFALLHGAGNGLMTVCKGSLPLWFFGVQGYGARLARILVPGKLAHAAAPATFGWIVLHLPVAALPVTTALGLLAVGLMVFLRARSTVSADMKLS